MFTYNNAGRLASVANGTTTTAYTYNALGELVRKSSGTVFFYDEAGHLLGEYSSSGVLIQETIWLDNIPVATVRPLSGGGIEIFYVHTDHLNAPRKITRPSDNKLRWRWDPTPFGYALPNENPASLGTFSYSLRFPGQVYLEESKLNYNYFRDYDSVTGRYVQSDPIGLAGGLNTYGYVQANPILQVDPFGLSASGAVGSLIDLLGFGLGTLTSQTYGDTSSITQDLRGTPVWKQIWEKFTSTGCNSGLYCGDFQYRQFFSTSSVVGQTVGSFCARLTKRGNTVDVEAFNVWGLESGTRLPVFPGLGSNRRNPSVQQMLNGASLAYPKSVLENRSSGPGKTVKTTYTWTEQSPCCGP